MVVRQYEWVLSRLVEILLKNAEIFSNLQLIIYETVLVSRRDDVGKEFCSRKISHSEKFVELICTEEL